MTTDGANETAVVERHGRVLVVDDSPVVRAVVSQSLRAAGYDVATAANGADALARVETEGFDAVVTDLRMPGLDGFELLEAIRARSLSVEVVILTGTHSQDIQCAIRALRLGAHDFLTKPPASPDEVVLTVDRAMEKKRLRDTNERLMRELAALSRIDPLTGVLNRRVFDEALGREVARARRYDYPLSLVLFDLDHFKRVNDTHGHRAGDAVLRAFAGLAVRAFREVDALHRYGGEEFVAVLPHTPLEGALEAARRVVRSTREASVDCEGKTLRVTASAGVATAWGADMTGDDLVAAADRALYRAKGEGRDRAVADAPGPPPAR